MAKQIIYVGVAVATDGIAIKRGNILNISMCVGDAYTFSANVAPQNGEYGESKLWAKYPQELEALKLNARPLTEVMVDIRTWLKQFQGTLVACSSIIDHSFLREAFQATGKDFPFGTFPIDVGTWQMKTLGRPRPSSVVGDQVAPAKVAKTRWSLITGGMMPWFGEKRTPTARRTGGLTLDAYTRLQQTRPNMRAAEQPRRTTITATPQANRLWAEPPAPPLFNDYELRREVEVAAGEQD